MVRNLVGTFLEIGRGQRRAADLAELISVRDRMAAGATVPGARALSAFRQLRGERCYAWLDRFPKKMSACEICRRSLSVQKGCSLQA